MKMPLQKRLPIEVLLRWHRRSVAAALKHKPRTDPEYASATQLRAFLGITDSGEWHRIMTTAGVPMGKRGGLSRDECLRVITAHYTRRGEMLVKKWELAERQVGTFRKP